MSKSDVTDFEKIFGALSFLKEIKDLNGILAVFGIDNLPTAQKYGIMFGCMTFTITVATVLTLLVMGGSFKRMTEQSQTGGASIPDAIEERVTRPLLLKRLLEAQERLLEKYPTPAKTDKMTPLCKMLVNVAPDIAKAKLVTENLTSENEAERKIKNDKLKELLPDGYEKNYIMAYRRCQDRPGGDIISGMPEARFEAYARASAGCGTYSSASYRRSYARIYEAVTCVNHGTEKTYREHWLERPGDIVGRTVRLEPLEPGRHLDKFFAMTCGDVYKENKGFDPNEVWAFHPEGSFNTPAEMHKSFVFQRKMNEAGFAIVENLTGNMVGVLFLTNDDPEKLSINIELPIVKPSSEGTVEPIEGCFMLIDRLFSIGYRRVELSVDSMDTRGKKLSGRLGFTQEGLIPKDRIIKESNRDSVIYGMLNSDWSKGARAFLFKKLHGEKNLKYDNKNEKSESEIEMQNRFLANEKAKEAAEDTQKK